MEENQNNTSETLGQFLSRHRQEKKVDIKTVAVNTRININILTDLEQDITTNLPNRTYLRGFVKSFARVIDADEKTALDLLDKQLNVMEPPAQTHEAQEPVHVNKILDQDFKNLEDLKSKVTGIPLPQILKFTSGLLILSVIVYFANGLFQSTKEEVEKVVQTAPKASAPIKPEKEVTQKEDKEKKLSEIQAKKDSEEKVKKEAEEKRLADEKAKKEAEEKRLADEKAKKEAEEKRLAEEQAKKEKETKTDKKEDSLEESPLNQKLRNLGYRFTPMNTPLFSVANDDKSRNEKLLPTKVRKALLRGKQNVFINAAYGDTWINYKNTNGQIKAFTLKKGKTLYIRGKKILLFIGRLSAVEVFYNNQHLKTSSPSGVKSLVFPQNLAKDFETPLFIFDKKRQKYFTKSELVRNLKL